jgi:ribonucleoside-diphosphate reductase alpha chain
LQGPDCPDRQQVPSGSRLIKIAGSAGFPYIREKRRQESRSAADFMNTVVKIEPKDIDAIPFQEASLDIWDKKYRLTAKDGTPIDKSMDETYQRVARALADVERADVREHWYERFLWALRRGAIPAGRVISNAGALEHKPATSTINCTVSGTIRDSMDDILKKVHEAGLTLKSGCGIGYEHSTLRPRGAYVSGAGAYTSGPLSFMDIFDKMCFTVSSAGGRRGAQMGTFDIGHPDVMEFIRAKRENGRLRQFNLSLLITDEFMQAVREDTEWKLAFPLAQREYEADKPDLTDAAKFVWREWPVHEGYVVNDEGLVACKIYKTLPARRMWDVIMTSTYDFAEPGFILIDRVNEMNNNWWCENIRATNPCVTADTWVQTSEGARQVRELVGRPFLARVDGEDHATGPEGFFLTAHRGVVRLATDEGYSLRLTSDHRVRRFTKLTRWSSETEWTPAGDLRPGDKVLLHDHRVNSEWGGDQTFDEGYLVGLLIGDGTLKADLAVLSVWDVAAAVNGGAAPGAAAQSIMNAVSAAATSVARRSVPPSWSLIEARREHCFHSVGLRDLANRLGLAPGHKTITPAIERASSGFYRGVLRGLFDADGSVQGSQAKGVSIRLAQSDRPMLEAVQRMLLRLGIVGVIYARRPAGSSLLPDGRGGRALYPTLPQYELVISGENIARFSDTVGFADADKIASLQGALHRYTRTLNRERFVATVASITEVGVDAVYDVQVPGVNSFDANGLHAHNCGEQPLPPYGSCLLGSVNLTRFVKHPFGEFAEFDRNEYREVVKIFTRMLDNVVEINGLPLEQQRGEILRKRRHGMGFLGLGSTMALLRMKYGTPEAVQFTEDVAREMAIAGWEAALELSREKGPAPIMNEEFTVTKEMLRKRPEMVKDGWKPGSKIAGRLLHAKYSRYMQRVAQVAPQLVHELAETGARFTHHTSIAPTGTISLSLANNASNGIEPSFAHHYFRNVIREGKKSKEKIDVYSFELLAYRELVNPHAIPGATNDGERLPDYFIASDEVTPKAHVEVQAAAQKWVDSSISKTANVPTDFPYAKFKDIYVYAHEQGLKGCTTFRFNPEAFQGVLVKEQDLKNTLYKFTLEDGSVVEVRGDEEIDYDGETHTAANLFDAMKDGYYGRY